MRQLGETMEEFPFQVHISLCQGSIMVVKERSSDYNTTITEVTNSTF